MKITTLLLLSPRHYSKLSWVKQHNHSDLYREHVKPDNELVKSIDPKLLGLWLGKFNTRCLSELSTTFLL